MSRPIKFRAWDKLNKVMLYGNDGLVGAEQHSMLMTTLDGELRKVFCEKLRGQTHGWYDAPWDAKDYEIMQYTGLKDKNGTPVYEGDIVRCTKGCPHIVEWWEELGGEFGGGMPGWYLSGLVSGYGKGYAWMGEEEVIGNIYEHPNLLENQ